MTTAVDRYRAVLERGRRDFRERRPADAPPLLTDAQIDLMVERYAAKRKRPPNQGTGQGIAKAGPSPISSRRSDELEYAGALRRIVLGPLFRSLRSGLSRAAAVSQAIAALDGVDWTLPEGLVAEEVAARAARLDGYHRARLIQTFRSAVGIDIRSVLNDAAIRPLMDAWRRENVSLIRTIPQRLHEGLYQRMSATFAERPFDRQALSRVLSTEFQSAGYNLRRLTRDQTGKAIGQLTQARHRQIGIEEYTWHTSQDERVRPSHAALDGTRQRWDSPPSVGHPKEDIQCRCVAIPYIPEAETGVRPPRGRTKGRAHYTRRGRPALRTPPEYTGRQHTRDAEYRSDATLSEGTKAYIAIGAPSKMQGVSYEDLNRLLRESKPLDAAHQRMLLQVMNDMRPLRSDRIVYRGIPEAIDASAGEMVPFPAFTSTSMNYELAFGGRTIYQIRVPQRTQAIVTNEGEREVLLPIGRKFHVVARTTDAHGRIVLIGDLK